MHRPLIALLALCLLAGGCARRQAAPRPRPAAPSRPAPTADTRTPDLVVVAYLQALYQGRERDAYNLLDAASRQQHPFTEFQKEATAGITQYDTASARAVRQNDTTALVNIRLLEDPASAGFHLRREQGAWRIIYTTGSPGFPYP